MCWTLPDRASSLVGSADFRPSPCAGPCCHLPLFGAPKGQEKGNVPRRKVSIQMAPIEPWRKAGSRIPTEFQTGCNICGSQDQMKVVYLCASNAVEWAAGGQEIQAGEGR